MGGLGEVSKWARAFVVLGWVRWFNFWWFWLSGGLISGGFRVQGVVSGCLGVFGFGLSGWFLFRGCGGGEVGIRGCRQW